MIDHSQSVNHLKISKKKLEQLFYGKNAFRWDPSFVRLLVIWEIQGAIFFFGEGCTRTGVYINHSPKAGRLEPERGTSDGYICWKTTPHEQGG